MPAPIIPQNKFSEQMENNLDLRNKMLEAFTYASYALSNAASGALDSFSVNIDGIVFEHINGDQIYIDGNAFSSLSPTRKTQSYDKLEKFMKIAIERYNTQYNL